MAWHGEAQLGVAWLGLAWLGVEWRSVAWRACAMSMPCLCLCLCLCLCRVCVVSWGVVACHAVVCRGTIPALTAVCHHRRPAVVTDGGWCRPTRHGHGRCSGPAPPGPAPPAPAGPAPPAPPGPTPPAGTQRAEQQLATATSLTRAREDGEGWRPVQPPPPPPYTDRGENGV